MDEVEGSARIVAARIVAARIGAEAQVGQGVPSQTGRTGCVPGVVVLDMGPASALMPTIRTLGLL